MHTTSESVASMTMTKTMSMSLRSFLATLLLMLWLFFLFLLFIFVIRHQTNFVELFLNELNRDVESSFFSHSVDLFGRDVLLFDKGFKNFEPFARSSVRNTVASTSSMTVTLTSFLLFLFSLFGKYSHHHDRVLTRVLDSQEGMRMGKSLFTFRAVVEVLANTALVANSKDRANITTVTLDVFMNDLILVCSSS